MSNSKTFQGSLFNTEHERNRAMCEAFLYGMHNSDEQVAETFAEASDTELATEMLSEWEDEFLTHGEAVEIFAELREELA